MAVKSSDVLTLELYDLLCDIRLARLFTKDDRDCAFQLWVLQIKYNDNGLTEKRIVYSRLLPYRYSNSAWSFSNNDDFQKFEKARAKVTKLNLYIKSRLCADLLRLICSGKSLSDISNALQLKMSK